MSSPNPFAIAVEAADEADRAAAEKALADAKRARAHEIRYYARGCETSSTCYCRATNGFDHHEDDSPWVVNMEGLLWSSRGEKNYETWPLDFPFRDGSETLQEKEAREAAYNAWNEGMEHALGALRSSGRKPDTSENPYGPNGAAR